MLDPQGTLPRPSPPLSAPPVLSMPDFLRLNGLAHCTELLQRQGISTLELLASVPNSELTAWGVHELDARRLVQCLNCYAMRSPGQGAGNSRMSCSLAGDALRQSAARFGAPQHQHQQPPGTPLQHSRSPLLSGSSIGTNHTSLTSQSDSRHGSTHSVGGPGTGSAAAASSAAAPALVSTATMPRVPPGARQQGFFV